MNILAWYVSVDEQSELLLLVLLIAKITFLLALAWILHSAIAASNPRWRVLIWRITAGGLLALLILSTGPQLFSLALLPGEIEPNPHFPVTEVPIPEAKVSAVPRDRAEMEMFETPHLAVEESHANGIESRSTQ